MEVHFFATLRPIVGGKSIALDLPERTTVQALVDLLAEQWPALTEHLFDEDGSLSRRVNIMLDGRNVRWLNGLDSAIPSGSKVEIFPPVAGG